MSKKEEFQKATENLRKAVPLMIKNQVPTTPSNYALWYTYVDNTLPELNRDLEEVIDQYGVCPSAQSQALYRTYVAQKTETDVAHMRQSLERLLSEVSHSMTDTLSNTSAFQSQIDKSFSSLERMEDEGLSFDEVMGLVRDLLVESKDIRHTTQFLNNQLNVASSEIEQLKDQLAKVQQDSLFDGLSSLMNRRAFDKDMEAYCSAGEQFCVVLLDIDHFKSYNDEYGHLFGDMVIKSIAKRLQTCCRDGIAAYRFGGEEFAYIVPAKNLRSSIRFAESVRTSLEKLTIRDKRSGKMVKSITASFGVAEYQPGESPHDLVDRSDIQLYEAKRLGRNRVLPV